MVYLGSLGVLVLYCANILHPWTYCSSVHSVVGEEEEELSFHNPPTGYSSCELKPTSSRSYVLTFWAVPSSAKLETKSPHMDFGRHSRSQ